MGVLLGEIDGFPWQVHKNHHANESPSIFPPKQPKRTPMDMQHIPNQSCRWRTAAICSSPSSPHVALRTFPVMQTFHSFKLPEANENICPGVLAVPSPFFSFKEQAKSLGKEKMGEEKGESTLRVVIDSL